MGEFKQLELPLWETLKQATDAPEEANLQELLCVLDETLLQLDTSAQLQVAASGFSQIVQVWKERCQLMFEMLASTGEQDPVMPEDAFDCFVRQTMDVDFSQFVELLPSLPRKAPVRELRGFADDGRSLVAVIDRGVLLQALEEQEEELNEVELYAQTMGVAYQEDVSVWVGMISNYFHQQAGEVVGLSQLQESLPLQFVEIWLGLLLGGFRLYRSSAVGCHSNFLVDDWFYQGEIWVECSDDFAIT